MEINPPTSYESPPSPRRYNSSPKSPKIRIISILNFDRNSADVVFTEPETIEALKILGYDQKEFSYKPLVSFYSDPINQNINSKIKKFDLDATNTNFKALNSSLQFRDSTLTENQMKNCASQEMYQKYLNKRQEMIDKTIQMRERIIANNSQPKSPGRITANVRKAKMEYDNSFSNLQKIENDNSNRLQKYTFVKMRDISREQDDISKSIRTTERFHEIDFNNTERTHFVDDLRNTRGFRSPESTLPHIDRTSYQGMNLLKTADFNKTLSPTGRSKWFTTQLTNMDETIVSMQLHENHLKNVKEKKEMMEFEKKEANLNYIKDKEDRSNRYMQDFLQKRNEKIEMKKKLMKRRAESVRQTRDDLDNRKSENTYNSYIENQRRSNERIADLKNQRFLNTLSRRIELQDKIQKVRHSYNAMNYQQKMERERKAEVDESMISSYKRQNQEIQQRKRKEILDFENSRLMLNNEVEKMKFDPNVNNYIPNGNQSMFSTSRSSYTSTTSNFSTASNKNSDYFNRIHGDNVKNLSKSMRMSPNQINEIMNEAAESKEQLAKTPTIIFKTKP